MTALPRSRLSTLQRLALIGALLTGFALRLHRLGAESLWYDETVSVFLAQKSIPALIAHTAGDIHPPGYYLLLHAWRLVVWPSVEFGLEFLYAWPSLVAGMLLLALLVPVARQACPEPCQRVFGARWATVATVGIWLGAINPFHVWYAQEVRMYTVGGALGLLCFWALWRAVKSPPPSLLPLGGGADASSAKNAVAQQDKEGKEETSPPTNQLPPPPQGEGWGGVRHRLPYLLLYAVAAAAGLYTLYYFAFLLIALNAMALLYFGFWSYDLRLPPSQRTIQNPKSKIVNLVAWLAAQLLVLGLFLPWLPTLYRQATDPPVPPWREPWTSARGLWEALAESLAAPLIGQSAPGSLAWPWAIGVVLLITYCLLAQTNSAAQSKVNGTFRIPHSALLIYFLLPTALIYAITLVGPPLYHVRYLFVYAAPLVLVFAWVLVTLWFRTRWLSVLIAALIVFGSGASLARFWRDPLLRADDHRSAVAELAAHWRPGDAILVNAGWAYTALEVYWPTELVGPRAVAPPKLGERQRLLDYADSVPPNANLPDNVLNAKPVVIRTGSVDGPPSLGWGNPESDFFAISQAETVDALAHVAAEYPRVWHYRIYDTVNDPSGLIRTWLEKNLARRSETIYAGDSFLNVQLYEASVTVPDGEPLVGFGDGAASPLLAGLDAPSTVATGNVLYATFFWRAAGPSTSAGQALPPLATSLRLADADGNFLPQQDEPLALASEGVARQPLALPIPVSIAPGSYTLELVVYDEATVTPLAPSPSATAKNVIEGERWLVGQVEIMLSPQAPVITRTLASFDYIDLLSADLASSASNSVTRQPGGALDLLLLWRPRPSGYRDTYDGIVELRDADGQIVQSWRGPLGSERYPSGSWVAGIPVQEMRALALDESLAAGRYVLRLRVERRSDGQVIPTRAGLLNRQPTVEIGRVIVE